MSLYGLKWGLPVLLAVGFSIPTPATRANLPDSRVSTDLIRVRTVKEALAYLENSRNLVTEAEFGRWCGALSQRDTFGKRWRLADGVLLTNCIQLQDGTLEISCWGVDKPSDRPLTIDP